MEIYKIQWGVLKYKNMQAAISDKVLYSTGNYIQYPVINRNGKEYKKKECLYVYNWVSLLHSRDWHSIVNQLYFKKFF